MLEKIHNYLLSIKDTEKFNQYFIENTIDVHYFINKDLEYEAAFIRLANDPIIQMNTLTNELTLARFKPAINEINDIALTMLIEPKIESQINISLELSEKIDEHFQNVYLLTQQYKSSSE